MKYKFYGEPNTSIVSKKPHWWNGEYKFHRVGKFDELGVFITSDEKIIEKMKARFDHVEVLDDEVILNDVEEIKEEIEYSEMPYNELRKIAKEKELDLPKNPTKEDILTALHKEV